LPIEGNVIFWNKDNRRCFLTSKSKTKCQYFAGLSNVAPPNGQVVLVPFIYLKDTGEFRKKNERKLNSEIKFVKNAFV